MVEVKIPLGETEVETLRLNGWGFGDILEGDEGYGPSRIVVTNINMDSFNCMWDIQCTGEWDKESGNTTLSCRNWKKVGNIFEMDYRGGLSECSE